jgi:hypothetical protein
MKLSPFRMMRRKEGKRREMLVLLVLKPQKERERVDQLRRMMMTNRMRISMWNKVSMKTRMMKKMTKMTMNRNKNKKRHLKQNLNKTILNLSKISKISKNHNKIIKTNPSPSLNRAKTGTIKATTTSHSRRTSISIKTKAGPSPKTDLPASHP